MRFPGGADFRGAHIPPGTRFDRATFGDRTGFDDARIEAGASFRGAVFGRWASFTFARIEESVDLAEALFGFASAFSGARISRRVNFSNATFGESAAFEGTSIGAGVRLRWRAFPRRGALRWQRVRRRRISSIGPFSKAAYPSMPRSAGGHRSRLPDSAAATRSAAHL